MVRAGANRTGGFTAVEALVASVVLAMLTAAVSGALMAGRAQSRLARETLGASFLAQSLMEEIMRLPFHDPNGHITMGPDADETRATFNNVDDFSGYTDGPGHEPDAWGVVRPISDLAGNAYDESYQGYVRQVSMTAVSSSPAGWNRTLNGLMVRVTVSKDGLPLVRLQRIAWDG